MTTVTGTYYAPYYNSIYCPRIEGSQSVPPYHGYYLGDANQAFGNKSYADISDSRCINPTMDTLSETPQNLFTNTFGDELMNYPVYKNMVAQKRSDWCNSYDFENNHPLGDNPSTDYCAGWFKNPQSWGFADKAVASYCDNYPTIPRPGDETYSDYMQICGCHISDNTCPQATDVRCAGGKKGNVTYEPAYRTLADMDSSCPTVNICTSYMNNSGFLIGEQKQKCSTTYGTPQNIYMIIMIFMVVMLVVVIGMVYYIKKRTSGITS